MFITLVQSRSIPLSQLESVLPLILERSKDKAANVRKASIQFLSTALEYNPYGPKLALSAFSQKLEEATKQDAGHNEDPAENNDNPRNNKSPSKQIQKKFYQQAVRFIKIIHQAIIVLSQLLESKTQSDILQSIEFLVKAKLFGIEHCDHGIRRLMVLIWSNEPPIQQAVTQAFSKLYLASKSPSKVIKLALVCNIGELASMEEVFKRLGNDSFSPQTVKSLWNIFSTYGKADEASKIVDARGALMVLSMLANSDRKLKFSLFIKKKLNPQVLQTCLSSYTKQPKSKGT